MRFGLQDSVLGQKPMFKKKRKEFVQMLRNEIYHWVLVSNINYTKNEIDYCDSLFHRKIKDRVKMQISKLCKLFEEGLSVNVRVCQK